MEITMRSLRNQRARVAGLAVGGGIGALLLLNLGPDPNTGSQTISFAAATFAGGAIGGWLVGPTAWRARRWAEWLKAIAAIAGIAVLVGDAVVVTGLTIHQSLYMYPHPDAMTAVGELLSLYAFGLLFVGWLYYVIALAIGSLWAGIILIIRGAIESRPAAT